MKDLDRTNADLDLSSIRTRSRLPDGLTRITARLQTAPQIAVMCQSNLGARVVDRTGLTSRYDFTLDFDNGEPSGPRQPSRTASTDGPDFATALDQQLGLRLRRAKSQVDLIVIDHLERQPAEN